jgi:hypothetical protein
VLAQIDDFKEGMTFVASIEQCASFTNGLIDIKVINYGLSFVFLTSSLHLISIHYQKI